MHVLPAFAGSTYSFIVPKKQNSVKEIFGTLNESGHCNAM